MLSLNNKHLASSEYSGEQSVLELRTWMESQTGLYGRTDKDFLLMFLCSCEFNLELTKKTISSYYEFRLKRAEWWANRDLRTSSMQIVMNFKFVTVLKDKNPHHPVLTVIKYKRMGCEANRFDSLVKFLGCVNELIARRPNCQANGHVVIVDLLDYPWWIVIKSLNPLICKDYVNSFALSLPLRLKKLVCVNAPSVANTVFSLCKPFLSQSIKNNIHIFHSDWSNLVEMVAPDLLPMEYGGSNGSLKQHEDAFIDELVAINDYLVDDNKYGLKSSQ